MLLLPKLVVKDGRCLYPEGANASHLFDDPVEMARMLRVMNARSILLDVQGATSPAKNRLEVAAAIAAGVDIPLQLDSGTPDEAFLTEAVSAGIYRCIVHVTTPEQASAACAMISKFGAQRLTVRFPSQLCLAESEIVQDLLSTLSESNCSRIILTLSEHLSWRSNPGFVRQVESINAIRSRRRLRITVDGGVTNAEDLLELQRVSLPGVDSIALHQPFFLEQFPCQAFWCWNQKSKIDLSAPSTATLKC